MFVPCVSYTCHSCKRHSNPSEWYISHFASTRYKACRITKKSYKSGAKLKSLQITTTKIYGNGICNLLRSRRAHTYSDYKEIYIKIHLNYIKSTLCDIFCVHSICMCCSAITFVIRGRSWSDKRFWLQNNVDHIKVCLTFHRSSQHVINNLCALLYTNTTNTRVRPLMNDRAGWMLLGTSFSANGTQPEPIYLLLEYSSHTD